MKRRGRRKFKSKPSGFGSLVQRYGGVRAAARTLQYDASYICLLAQGRRRVINAVLDRVASLGQSERP